MPSFKDQTIVVPFDFSAPSRNALTQVQKWADGSNTIHLIHVVVPTATIIDINPPVWTPGNLDIETRERTQEKMEKDFDFDNMKHHCMIGDPGTEIAQLAKNEKADMIIMPSHGRSGLSRLFLGSVAERVLRLAHCPVLVLRGSGFESEGVAVMETAEAGSSGV